MNCCDRIFILFLFITFLQFALRWQRDTIAVSQPWQLYVKGNTTTLESKTSSTISFSRYAHGYGTVPIRVSSHNLIIGDRNEIIVHVHVNVTAPPKSFHRVVLSAKDYPIEQMSVYVSPIGSASVHMTKHIIHRPNYPISLKHFYDEGDGEAQVRVTLLVRSGQYNLWDVTWTGVYIHK